MAETEPIISRRTFKLEQPPMRAPSHRPAAPHPPAGTHVGQALVEYLLVISVIALLCIPALAVLRTATVGAFGAQAALLNAPHLAVTPGSGFAMTYTYPASDEQCQGGLWITYYTAVGGFPSQGDCQRWVATNHPTAPAVTPTP